MNRPTFSRWLRETQLILATHNAGKLAEITPLFAPHGISVVSSGQLGLAAPEETGSSFIANATLKARFAAGQLPALADDSGLVVPALGGAPGIFSARWADGSQDFYPAMRRVHAALATSRPVARRAVMVCALAIAWPDGAIVTVEGLAWGELVWPPRGGRGFGYDPVFLPDGHNRTYGEMTSEEKQAISHRADAFARLLSQCVAA